MTAKFYSAIPPSTYSGTLREGCEVVILIETGLSLRPKKMVPLHSNFHKGFPPLSMCTLRPYDDGS